ncbi:MAG TPA: biotin/lipoyl-containing protein, partial [Candidatus Lustribacter sp.]|nr:biotin/lipoyl-containing protein [Candidatus Lustribacter sp.]
MSTTIRMPQLGETVTEGTVARWLKQPGEAVDKYEAFVEVSTDKVNAEVPSPVAGTIRELIVAEGETVPTGAPIAVIDETGAPRQPLPPAAQPTLPMEPARVEPATGHSNGAIANGLRVSPAVRRLAREHSVNLASVTGTGMNGRVTAADIVAAAAGPVQPPLATAPAPPPVILSEAPVGAQSKDRDSDDEIIPLTPSRRLIARR